MIVIIILIESYWVYWKYKITHNNKIYFKLKYYDIVENYIILYKIVVKYMMFYNIIIYDNINNII